MDRPVFILGCHKSGTSLVRSLLDGHPDLFCVPVESHFFQLAGFGVEYALRRSPPETLTFQGFVERIIQHLERSSRGGSTTSDSELSGRWNLDTFGREFSARGQQAFESGDLRQLFEAYIESLHFSIHGGPMTPARFAEKSVEHAEFAVDLERLYPDARFVHIVRNPYATLSALRHHMTRKHFPFLGGALAALQNSYYWLYRNLRLIAAYKVLRYETLVTSPADTMAEIADFLGLRFSDCLLQPTLLETPWRGNSTSGEPLQGIATSRIHAWRDAIHPVEIDCVNRLYGHVLRDYDYEELRPPKSPWRPSWPEKPTTYLTNRWLWLLAKRGHPTPSWPGRIKP